MMYCLNLTKAMQNSLKYSLYLILFQSDTIILQKERNETEN